MENQWDELAKSVGSAVTRRDILRCAGGALLAGVLAWVGGESKGVAAQGSTCGHCCSTQCRTLFPPEDRGEEFALCIRECHQTGFVQGFGVCTDVCPQ